MQGSAQPTFAAAEAAGANSKIGCMIGHACDSVSGTITLTTGSNPAIGRLVMIGFGTARSGFANCVLENAWVRWACHYQHMERKCNGSNVDSKVTLDGI
jgi:hypothetical protein